MTAPIGDNRQPSYPNNTHKQDWAYYPYIAGHGGDESGIICGVTRFSFWIDFDPFDILNRKLFSQNVAFQIFEDADLSEPLIPYIIIDESNDITDEIIKANLPTVTNPVTSYGTASIALPPTSFLDDGSYFENSGVPPTSSGVAAPTGVTATATNTAGTAYDSNLVIGQKYYYVVTAVVGTTESVASSVVSATITADLPEISIAWIMNPSATYYNIYRNTTNNFTSGSLLLRSYYYAGQPPYYNNTVFTSQPSNRSFLNDQGNYTLGANKGNGVTFGNGKMVGQGFVPQQSKLTAITLGEIFRADISDHTTFQNVIFELWDSNKTFYKHLGTLSPIFNPAPESELPASTPAGLTLLDGNTAHCNTITYDTQDDGQIRWVDLLTFQIQFTTPIPVTVGSTYYIILRTPTQTSSSYYALGGNYDNAGNADPLHYYPFAPAIIATDGSSSFSNLTGASGTITFPFLTLGNVGRYAVTFWWANVGNGANNYWPEYPNNNEYVFLHLDYNARI